MSSHGHFWHSILFLYCEVFLKYVRFLKENFERLLKCKPAIVPHPPIPPISTTSFKTCSIDSAADVTFNTQRTHRHDCAIDTNSCHGHDCLFCRSQLKTNHEIVK